MPFDKGEAAPAFTLEDEFGAKISLKDFRDSHTRFVRKHKLNFTLLSDPTMKVTAKYGAYGEKTMYGRKTVGVIRSTVWIGPNGKVKNTGRV